MRVWKKWTDEHQTTRKTGSGRRKVTSARDGRHLLRMAMNDCTASSRQLVYCCRCTYAVFIDVCCTDHDGHIRVRRYAGERYLPECVIERHSGLTSGGMVWGVILYHRRSTLLRIEGIPRAMFQQDNAPPNVRKTVRDFCSAQYMQLLPWPAYSPNMSPIEWDLVSRRLGRDPRPASSKGKLLLRIQSIWNSLPQANIQNLLHSLPRRIAALFAARGG
ncbi:transposable element Tcb2 transposase [Trichonephila clavipes]|nr:transposable element Tcb2 transposase [Trichonephila clavipes]